MLELNDGVQTLLARYVGTDLYVDGKLDVLRLCEDLKIKVINYEFSDQRISGAIVRTPNEWLIYLNDKDSRRRKRFTVAHEIGHYISFEAGSYSKPFLENGQLITDMGILWRKQSVQNLEAQKAETEANKIAADILMPKEEVKRKVEANCNIEEMADFFDVSESAIVVRLDSLGYRLMESMSDSLVCN